jgi:MFS family permease
VIISFLANVSAITGGIGFGYPAITSQLLLSGDADVVLTQSQVSWFASITAITCPIGGPLSGYLLDKIGRRNTLMVINVIAFVSWIIIGFSSRDNDEMFFIQIMLGRFIIGVAIGMITTAAVTYSSEVCHPSIRGRVTVLSSPLFVAFGMLIAYLLGYMIPVRELT